MRQAAKIARAAGVAMLFIAAPPPAFANTTLPPMKPGFWQGTMVMHMNMSGQPADTDATPMVSYNCQDAASMAAALKMMAGGVPGCAFDLEGAGGKYTLTTSCKDIGGQPGRLDGVGTITMQGDSAMHMEATSNGNIGNMQMSSKMTEDSKWIGACPAGVKPGDFGRMQDGVFQKMGNTLTAPPGQ